MKRKFLINPLIIILCNIVIPVFFICIKPYPLHYFLLGFGAFVLILGNAIKRLLKFLIVYVILLALYILFTGILPAPMLSVLTYIWLQIFPCLMLGSVLFFDYNSSHILSSLCRLHLPRMLTVAIVITLRYIPTFKTEFSYIKESMRLRGFTFTPKKPLQSFKYFIVPQLFRCLAISEEVTSAGLCKGINAPFRRTSYYDCSFKPLDFIMILIFILCIIGGVLWN